jgi:hypothetical protein
MAHKNAADQLAEEIIRKGNIHNVPISADINNSLNKLRHKMSVLKQNLELKSILRKRDKSPLIEELLKKHKERTNL